MLKNVEIYKNLCKSSQHLHTTTNVFSGNVSTFLDKVMKDSLDGVKIYEGSRLELDAFKQKLSQAEAKAVLNKDNPRFQRDLEIAKTQMEEVEQKYIDACNFLKSKVELLNDTKTHRLFEQFTILARTQKKYFSVGAAVTSSYK